MHQTNLLIGGILILAGALSLSVFGAGLTDLVRDRAGGGSWQSRLIVAGSTLVAAGFALVVALGTALGAAVNLGDPVVQTLNALLFYVFAP
jgi:hypothetical protein